MVQVQPRPQDQTKQLDTS